MLTLLDLSLLNREGLGHEVVISGHFGHSDHEVVKFKMKKAATKSQPWSWESRY